MQVNYDINFIKQLMEHYGCKNLNELMEKEMNFDDNALLQKLNSPEFSLKLKDIKLNLNLTDE